MFRFPDDSVRGWLSPAEGALLAACADGKTVLEIGSYCGRSTICLAQTALSVDAVDPFDGRATPEPGTTLAEFIHNITAYGVAEKVHLHNGTSDEIGPTLEAKYDLVFIDGDHSYLNVRNDIEWALRLLKPDGHIAFHDYRHSLPDAMRDFGVNMAVNDLLSEGGEVVQRADSLAIVKPPRELVTGKASRLRLVMAMPHRGWSKSGRAFWRHPTLRPNAYDFLDLDMSSSVLELNFNRMWCEALNAKQYGFTHFVMLHDDVCPEIGWLDVLVEEITRLQADVVSAIVPIKSAHGLTSTALGNDGQTRSVWRPLRRLTMTEAFELPETFNREQVPLEGPPSLFINTGCWIADLRKPWAEKNVFRNVSRNVVQDGKWKADCLSEDWAFSCDLSRWGASVYATRKVKLYHDHPAFHNKTAWGMWQTDEEYFQRTGKPAETE